MQFFVIHPEPIYSEMLANGFMPNETLNCYIKEGYGAFMGNIILEESKSLEEYIEKNAKYYAKFLDGGCGLHLGPPAPVCSSVDISTIHGLYCYNWEDYLAIDSLQSDSNNTSRSLKGLKGK